MDASSASRARKTATFHCDCDRDSCWLPASALSCNATGDPVATAWNSGAALYVILAADMRIRSDHHRMHRRAQLQDDGQVVLLAHVVVATLASLVAIASELSAVKDAHGLLKIAHASLAGFTVLSCWAFIQVMFTLHFAHDYHAHSPKVNRQVSNSPGHEEPDYGDFFYFAAVIGTSGQTADVSVVTKSMRRIGSLHCILAYLFNTTVLALLIPLAQACSERRTSQVITLSDGGILTKIKRVFWKSRLHLR